MKRGKIDISQLKALPEKHELETADHLAHTGHLYEWCFVGNQMSKGQKQEDNRE